MLLPWLVPPRIAVVVAFRISERPTPARAIKWPQGWSQAIPPLKLGRLTRPPFATSAFVEPVLVIAAGARVAVPTQVVVAVAWQYCAPLAIDSREPDSVMPLPAR